LSFLTVSGEAATRVSPAVVSVGTPISIECLLVGLDVDCCRNLWELN
jgi:hypothetical protein